MAKPTPAQVLTLYRQMLKTSNQFVDFNFRKYALRVVKEDFHTKSTLADPAEITKAYEYGISQYHLLQRQTQISRLYASRQVFLDSPHPELYEGPPV